MSGSQDPHLWKLKPCRWKQWRQTYRIADCLLWVWHPNEIQNHQNTQIRFKSTWGHSWTSNKSNWISEWKWAPKYSDWKWAIFRVKASLWVGIFRRQHFTVNLEQKTARAKDYRRVRLWKAGCWQIAIESSWSHDQLLWKSDSHKWEVYWGTYQVKRVPRWIFEK